MWYFCAPEDSDICSLNVRKYNPIFSYYISAAVPTEGAKDSLIPLYEWYNLWVPCCTRAEGFFRMRKHSRVVARERERKQRGQLGSLRFIHIWCPTLLLRVAADCTSRETDKSSFVDLKRNTDQSPGSAKRGLFLVLVLIPRKKINSTQMHRIWPYAERVTNRVMKQLTLFLPLSSMKCF